MNVLSPVPSFPHESIRFGVIGTGWPALQHGRALRHVPGAELVAGCDVDADRRRAYGLEFPAARMHGTYKELLADAKIDAVIVALPNFLHFPATLAALEAGKHVLCEKPPTMNVAEAETIRAEAARRGLTYGFGRQFRFSSEMLAARRLVEDGALGKIYFAKGQWLRLRGTPTGVGGWFADKARAGGGAVIDLGVHSLDAVWYLAGCPRPCSVTAQTGSYFLNGSAPGVEDTGFAFLRFEGGLVVSLEIAWSMNLSDAGAETSEWWGLEAANTTLHGDLAALQISPPMLFRVDAEAEKILIKTPLTVTSADDFERLPSPQSAFVRQLVDFSLAVRTGVPPTNDATQAIELMKMLDGIYKSSACGHEIRFDQ